MFCTDFGFRMQLRILSYRLWMTKILGGGCKAAARIFLFSFFFAYGPTTVCASRFCFRFGAAFMHLVVSYWFLLSGHLGFWFPCVPFFGVLASRFSFPASSPIFRLLAERSRPALGLRFGYVMPHTSSYRHLIFFSVSLSGDNNALAVAQDHCWHFGLGNSCTVGGARG